MKPILFVLTLSALFSSCKGQDNSSTPGKEIAIADVQTAEVIPVVEKLPEWNIDLNLFNWTSDIKPTKPIAFVRQMTADKDGNVWFASWNGMVRYNISFENNPCNLNTCNHDHRYISQEIAHRLETDKLITRFTQFDSLQFFHVLCVFRDSKENIWFGTRYHGVYRYDGREFQQFDKATGLGENQVICITEDNAGRMWFGTTSGLSIYDENAMSEGRSGFTNFNKDNGLPDNMVLTLLQDAVHDRILVGTQEGLCYFSGTTLSTLNNSSGLPFRYVETLFIDSDKTLWIGHSDGLTAYDGKTFNTFTKNDGLPENFVACITETNRNGNKIIWLGIRDSFGQGLGICSYDGKSFSHMTGNEGLPNKRILNMITDSDGNIWMGTSDGVFRYDGVKFKTIAREEGC